MVFNPRPVPYGSEATELYMENLIQEHEPPGSSNQLEFRDLPA